MEKLMIICWWSGGITSAVACALAQGLFRGSEFRFIFMDTGNEDEDTYRFKSECEELYGQEIETISAIPHKHKSIQDVWRKNLSLNVATGAICSYQLKRKVREDWQKENEFDHQVFGFEFETNEFKRARSMLLNHPNTKPVFPLLLKAMNKKDCIEWFEGTGIEIPRMYKLGFSNNNCFGTGCVQGGGRVLEENTKRIPREIRRYGRHGA
jgi:hypothetical protein